jgi:hypothetical protein
MYNALTQTLTRDLALGWHLETVMWSIVNMIILMTSYLESKLTKPLM